MKNKLNNQTGYNKHEKILGSYQHGGTASISRGNLIGNRTASKSNSEVPGRWTWKLFRGRGVVTLRISTCYHHVPPILGGGANYVYNQHLTHY